MTPLNYLLPIQHKFSLGLNKFDHCIKFLAIKIQVCFIILCKNIIDHSKFLLFYNLITILHNNYANCVNYCAKSTHLYITHEYLNKMDAHTFYLKCYLLILYNKHHLLFQ